MMKKFESYGVNDWLYDEYSNTIDIPLIEQSVCSRLYKNHISKQQELKYILDLISKRMNFMSKIDSQYILEYCKAI